jgi:adenylate kinase family enzyme
VRRVVVVGTSGSGKTTFAAALAARLGVPCVELDALHWGPGWTPAPSDTFRARVVAATAGPAWVVDGNYSTLRELTWGRADTLVWLDYALPVVVTRLVRRTLTRMWRREELWGTGNRETWRNVFFARDSLLRWAVGQHGRQRRRYPALLTGEFAHLRRYRIRSPAGAAAWLQTVTPTPAPATA